MRNPVIDVATSYGKIDIGKQGENLTNAITFDCAAWLDGLTGGVLSLVHQRPGDDDAYPVANYTPSDTALLWQPNETDLAYNGIGQCELRYTIGTAIAKSKTFLTVIERGLTPLDTPPEAYEPYIDRVIDAARQEMDAMTVSASATRGDSASASVEKSIEDGHENLAFSFVLPKGDTGNNGIGISNVNVQVDGNVGTPTCDVTKVLMANNWVITLKFKNLKGAQGIPGASFDTAYLPYDVAEGSPAVIYDGAKDVPIDELIANIVAFQSGSGDPAPSNPRPILGHDNVTIIVNSASETVDFNQTVYGGYFDSVSGKLTITHGYIADLSQLSWSYQGTYTAIFQATMPQDCYAYSETAERNQFFICSSYKPSESLNINANMDDLGMLIANRSVKIRNNNYDNDIDSFVPSLSGVQLVYRLDTPVEVDLGEKESRTLLGENTFSSNIGNVTVKYRADIKLYIDKKLAALQEE